MTNNNKTQSMKLKDMLSLKKKKKAGPKGTHLCNSTPTRQVMRTVKSETGRMVVTKADTQNNGRVTKLLICF